MERSTVLLAVTLALYFFIFILGFLQATGLGLVTQRLHGCPLFSESTNFATSFGSMQHCNYVIYMPVVVSIVFGLLMFIYHAYALIQAIRLPNIVPGNTVSTWIVTSIVALILTLIGASLTSAGLYWFCLSNRYLLGRFFNLPTSCIPGETTAALFRGYDPYYELRMTEAAYWLSAIAWLVVVIITILRLSAIRKESGTASSGFSSGNLFRGVTLIPSKGKKGEKLPSTTTAYEQAGTLETKIRPLETAA